MAAILIHRSYVQLNALKHLIYGGGGLRVYWRRPFSCVIENEALAVILILLNRPYVMNIVVGVCEANIGIVRFFGGPKMKLRRLP